MAKSTAKNKAGKKPAPKAKPAAKAKAAAKSKPAAKPSKAKTAEKKKPVAAKGKSKVVVKQVKPAGKGKPTGSKSAPIVLKARTAKKPVKAAPAPKKKTAAKPAAKAKAPVKPVVKAAAAKKAAPAKKVVSKAKPAPAKPVAKKAAKAVAKPVAKPVQKTKTAKPAPKPVKGNIAKAKPVAKKAESPVAKAKPVVEKAKAVLAKVVPALARPKTEKKAEAQPVENTSMERTRYSDEELQEFRELINKKLAKARNELEYLQQSIKSPGENATDDSFSANKLMEDNSMSTEKEHMSQLAERMRKFVKNLEDALVRIENKTYGICKVTGKLISKERLRAVPHTTMSIEAKLKQNK